MSTATLSPPSPPMPPPVQSLLASMATFRQTSVAEYEHLTKIGVLTPEDRVELIDGFVVNKMPHDDPHASTVDRLDEDLRQGLPKGWRVRIQLPIRLGNSLPEPDAVVVRGDRRTYDQRKPTTTDFGTVIEVADSSLRYDRVVKSRMYAAGSIPIYWIINLIDSIIEVYTDPDTTAEPPAYRTRTDYAPGQAVPLVLDGQTIAQIPIADLLP